ncbi:MAG: winged helix-turn-helix transcriptional regulator [Planctomycetes bacterium]|nr:winged helix-turn-helix transcriptional regulator [Planctomycetota bacterium]
MKATRSYEGHPSLWRTCRGLANRVRLRMVQHLRLHPGQSVRQIARALHIRPNVASPYLRILNARGLLRVERSGREVLYTLGPDKNVPQATPLVKSLRSALASGCSLDRLFRSLTAFTHPRREVLFRALEEPGLGLRDLKRRTGISSGALRRHLRKLTARGFVASGKSAYTRIVPQDAFCRALAELALASGPVK